MRISRYWLQVSVLLLMGIFCAAIWFAALQKRSPSALTFAALSVGQGDALYIESPSGVQVLIDGGPDSSVLQELPSVMPAFDRSLDAVVATHPDADHIAGLVEVMRRYEVEVFVEPGVPKSTATYAALLTEVKRNGAVRYVAERGTIIDMGGGAQLHIFLPARDVSRLSDSEVNEGGIVAQLVYGKTEILLTADVPKFVEYQLTALDGGRLQSDVLKVGHHGSRTSTSDILLQHVRPSVALISAGADNRYGHPHKETLSSLERFGVEVLGTYDEGTIILRSDGKTFSRSR